MKILAFMQNPWFRPGTTLEWIERYRDNQEFHRRILAKSMSGRRLHMAFGARFNDIHWDNVNWRAGSASDTLLPPDYDHIKAVLDLVKPDLIICFGKIAMHSLQNVDPPVPVWGCHHPNARGKTQQDLDNFAQMVIDYETAYHIRTPGNGEDHRTPKHSGQPAS